MAAAAATVHMRATFFPLASAATPAEVEMIAEAAPACNMQHDRFTPQRKRSALVPGKLVVPVFSLFELRLPLI